MTGGSLSISFLFLELTRHRRIELNFCSYWLWCRGTGSVFQAMVTGHPIKAGCDWQAPSEITNQYHKIDHGKIWASKCQYQRNKLTCLKDIKPQLAQPDVWFWPHLLFRPMHFEEAVKGGEQIYGKKPLATDAAGNRRGAQKAAKRRQRPKKAKCVVDTANIIRNNIVRRSNEFMMEVWR